MTRRDFEPILKKYSRSGLKLKPYLKTSTTQIVNAKSVYAKGVDSTAIVALFDTTFLKNGKTGYLLTLDGLYSSQFGGKVIRFDSVKAVEAASGKLQVTWKNGRKTEFSVGEYAPGLCALLRDVLALQSAGTAPGKAKSTSSRKKTPPQAQREQTSAAQAEFARQLEELDTFLDELVIEEKPAHGKPTPEEKPAPVQPEAEEKTNLDAIFGGMDKVNCQLKELLPAEKPVQPQAEAAAGEPTADPMPAQWLLVDTDTETRFEAAVLNVMENDNLKEAMSCAVLAMMKGHTVAEQLLWLIDGELEKHSDSVHPFFRAVDAYSKKRYSQAVAQFQALAEQGCVDAMIALGYDAILPVNGPVDLERAELWRDRVRKIQKEKGSTLTTCIINEHTKQKMAELPDIDKLF